MTILESREKAKRQKQKRTGHRNANRALTDEQVRKIRQRYKEGGIAHIDLALEHGVSWQTIFCIVNNMTYRDVDPNPPKKEAA